MSTVAHFADTGRGIGRTNTGPADAADVTPSDIEYARALVMDDMDMFTDFISCHGSRSVSSERITRHPALIPQRVEAADLPQLLHLFANSDDASTVVAARDELVRRYLADNRRYIARVAGNLACDRVAT